MRWLSQPNSLRLKRWLSRHGERREPGTCATLARARGKHFHPIRLLNRQFGGFFLENIWMIKVDFGDFYLLIILLVSRQNIFSLNCTTTNLTNKWWFGDGCSIFHLRDSFLLVGKSYRLYSSKLHLEDWASLKLIDQNRYSSKECDDMNWVFRYRACVASIGVARINAWAIFHLVSFVLHIVTVVSKILWWAVANGSDSTWS